MRTSTLTFGGSLPGYAIIIIGLLCAGVLFLAAVGVFWCGLSSLDPFGTVDRFHDEGNIERDLGTQIGGVGIHPKVHACVCV